QTSGAGSGAQEVAALNDASLTSRVLGDLKLMFQQIGNEPAFVHLEPDFWGFAQQVNNDPTKIPAKVQQFAECSGQPQNLTGFVQCVFSLARTYAPNAKIGLHGSPWGTGTDISINNNASVDPAAEARKLASFLNALGAGGGDFVAVDASDRDAAWY